MNSGAIPQIGESDDAWKRKTIQWSQNTSFEFNKVPLKDHTNYKLSST